MRINSAGLLLVGTTTAFGGNNEMLQLPVMVAALLRYCTTLPYLLATNFALVGMAMIQHLQLIKSATIVLADGDHGDDDANLSAALLLSPSQ